MSTHGRIADDPALTTKRDTDEYRRARDVARDEIAAARAAYKRRTTSATSQTSPAALMTPEQKPGLGVDQIDA